MNTVTLKSEAVAAIFQLPDITQSAAIVEIYKLVYPRWEEVESIGTPGQSWPQCNKITWGCICNHFIALDHVANKERAFDKQVMPGGIWLNNGFSATDPDVEELKDWEVRLCPVTYAKREAA